MKNRNLNKLTAIGALAMMLMPMTTFAAMTETQNVAHEETEENRNPSDTMNTDVLYTQTSNYSVVIPKTIVLDGATKAADYTVNVKGDISADKQVVVAPQDSINDIDGINFYMIDQAEKGVKKANVQADVTQNDTVWSSEEVCKAETGTTKDGRVEAPSITAGNWKGTFTFNIALENVQ